jgi:hypothetical protein
MSYVERFAKFISRVDDEPECKQHRFLDCAGRMFLFLGDLLRDSAPGARRVLSSWFGVAEGGSPQKGRGRDFSNPMR